MPRGRPLAPLALTTTDRATLEQWTRRRTTAQALALRARIILRAATGQSNTVTATWAAPTSTATARPTAAISSQWLVS